MATARTCSMITVVGLRTRNGRYCSGTISMGKKMGLANIIRVRINGTTCWISRRNTANAESIQDSPSSRGSAGNITRKINGQVGGMLPTMRNWPISRMDRFTHRWNEAVASVIHGSTVSGKTTFFT